MHNNISNIIIFNPEHGTMAIRRADDVQFVLHVCRMSCMGFFFVVVVILMLLSCSVLLQLNPFIHC